MDDQLLVLQFTSCHCRRERGSRGEAFIFSHLGYINKKIWHFSGLMLAPDSGCSDILQLSVPMVHFGEHSVATDLEIIQGLIEFDMKWVVRVLEISLDEDHWANGTLTSSTFPVQPLESMERFIVWQGSQKESAMRTENAKAKKKPTVSKKRELDPLSQALNLMQPKKRRTEKSNKDQDSEPILDLDIAEALGEPIDAGEDVIDNKGVNDDEVISEVASDGEGMPERQEQDNELMPDEVGPSLALGDAVECPVESALEPLGMDKEEPSSHLASPFGFYTNKFHSWYMFSLFYYLNFKNLMGS